MSGVVLLFSITGLLQWFTRTIPTPVVKGIQVGAGLSLIISAGTSLLQPLGWTSPAWADNLIWALLAFLALLTTLKISRFPYALVVFIIGIMFSICLVGRNDLPSIKIWHPQLHVPSWSAFMTGAIDAGLGQIPLTTLNSVIAVCYLSADLLPNLPAPSVTAMGTSVAMMNLVGGFFGAMPVCHGSGGLAAQYRFGARSGASIIILGVFKVILGLIFGESLIALLRHYPASLLGIMVLAAGIELAKVGENLNHGARDLWVEASESTPTGDNRHGLESTKQHKNLSDEERSQRWTIMMMTVAGLLAFKNDAVGFAAGMLCHWTYQVPRFWAKWEQFSWNRRRKHGASVEPSTGNEGEEQQLLGA